VLRRRGVLYVLNRLDDRIITGGENVEPGEVIDVLREFPSAEDAAVVGSTTTCGASASPRCSRSATGCEIPR